MKKIITSVFVVLSALTACTVQNQGRSYDEVYYSPNDQSTIVQNKSPLLHKSTRQVAVKADSIIPSKLYIGNNGSNPQISKSLMDSAAYVTDNNFNYDDYYDYSYASRIRRFQYSPFNDYYHDFYTNRYWYDYNPGYWGSSIYSSWGMNPGMAIYMDPFSFSWGMYSPFNGFYDPFYSPFGFDYYGFGNGGYGLGYGGYGLGYGSGYYGGIYSYGGGYSNSYDQNSRTYYGPRREGSASNGPTPAQRTAFSQHYTAFSGAGGPGALNVNSPNNGREIMNTSGGQANTGLKAGAVNQDGTAIRGSNLFGPSSMLAQRVPGSYTREQLNRNDVNRYVSNPAKNQPVNSKRVDVRSMQQQQSGYFKDRAVGSQSPNSGTVRYTKPQQTAAPRQYYTPANSRPRSGNEYTSPGYRNPNVYNSYQAPQRSVSDPQRYAPPRTYQTPSGSQGRVSNYNSYRQESSAPANYNSPSRSTYSAPVQSYSAPAQTYSAPAQTYSAPSGGGNSRESGSSSSGSSSGSSSTGPRR